MAASPRGRNALLFGNQSHVTMAMTRTATFHGGGDTGAHIHTGLAFAEPCP
jgi:hypothetical protein